MISGRWEKFINPYIHTYMMRLKEGEKKRKPI